MDAQTRKELGLSRKGCGEYIFLINNVPKALFFVLEALMGVISIENKDWSTSFTTGEDGKTKVIYIHRWVDGDSSDIQVAFTMDEKLK